MSSKSKGLVYYTNHDCDPEILDVVISRLKWICRDFDIVSVSKRPIDFGRNIVVNFRSGWLSILRQIRLGVEASHARIIYLAEHDVLYHSSHFDKIPRRHDRFYYNQNCWSVNANTGDALFRRTRRTSQLVATKLTLTRHFDELFGVIARIGYKKVMGIAPGTHDIAGVTKRPPRNFNSLVPNIDIRHGLNITRYEFEKEGFSNRESAWWKESDEIPGWGRTKGRFNEFLIEARIRDSLTNSERGHDYGGDK